MKTIEYGIGRNYLPNWGIKEALREIYQNYIDYGEYKELITTYEKDKVIVNISNNYSPKGLEFLRIGNSDKGDNISAVGNHGEGLKMAVLIFLREGFELSINSKKYCIEGEFRDKEEIGEVLCLNYKEELTEGFEITFTCDKIKFNEFKSKLLVKEDYIFTVGYHGSIVNKPKGDLYSGGLFICNLSNLSKSYDINPERLKLDRDRRIPPSFEVNYHSSKINEAQGEWNKEDLTYSDTSYVEKIPPKVLEGIRIEEVGNSYQFTTKIEGETKVISNESIVETLKKDSFFSSIIKSIKLKLAKSLGVYDLLLEFKEKHNLSQEAIQDLNVIIEKIDK